MKKIIALTLALTMSLSCFSLISFAEGTDTVEHLTEVPEGYMGVYTIEDLYCVRNDLTANYILMNDIDLTEAAAEGGDWDYAGRGWNPIGSNDVYSYNTFSGVFDGNGHSINGMRISVSGLPEGASQMYLGLFSAISGLVKNLTIDGTIYANISTANNSYAGGISAYCSGIIEKCTNRVKISVTNRYEPSSEKNVYSVYVGGISGYSSGKILECTNSMDLFASVAKGVSVNSYPAKTYYSTAYSAGICGIGGTVYNCINSGNITTESTNAYTNCYSSGVSHSSAINNSYNVGDIIAKNKKTYSNAYAAGVGYNANCSYCYNVGLVSGESAQKAISNNSVTKCYYLAGVGGNSTGATPLTDAQMKLKSMYSNWDFDTIWTIEGRTDYLYPELRDVALVLPEDPIHKHKYTSEVTNPATHISTGVLAYSCDCGDTYTEDIEKLADHNYESVVTTPTCIAKGYTAYTCECGDNYVADYVDATGHDFKPTVTAPTCTEHGYTTFTCECGENYTRDYANAIGHKDGNSDYKCDNSCGYEYEKPAHNTPSDPTEDCSCNCHKGGISSFFFKIINFFQKLFGQNKVCECGAKH